MTADARTVPCPSRDPGAVYNGREEQPDKEAHGSARRNFLKKRLCQHLLDGRPVDMETKSIHRKHCLDRDDWGFDRVRDLNTP